MVAVFMGFVFMALFVALFMALLLALETLSIVAKKIVSRGIKVKTKGE